MKNIAYTIQTCDGGSHRRKDRVNGGMYITDGVVSMVLSTMQPQETLIVYKKRCDGNMCYSLPCSKRKLEVHGCSFDLFYGCPTHKEVAPTLKVSTSPGHHSGCIVKKVRA